MKDFPLDPHAIIADYERRQSRGGRTPHSPDIEIDKAEAIRKYQKFVEKIDDTFCEQQIRHRGGG